jgi:hypothetical protein
VTRQRAIAAYKSFLRGCIDRRPSGLRGRLAEALGKHKSFITQITNPAYRLPIPAGDLATIAEICHLSPAERERFLELYRLAHPDRPTAAEPQPQPHELRIALPGFSRESTAREVEATIRTFAQRTIRLAQRVEAAAIEGGLVHEEARQRH